MMNDTKPLDGYLVVELSTFMAAPSCGRMLADWGADVIKVEMTGGDPWRKFGRSMKLPTEEEAECPAWDLYNAGKRSLALDIRTAEGRLALHKLLEKADVFLTNNRVRSLKKRGLDYDSLKTKYPRLVYALVTGFGEKGPDTDLPGYDVSAFWARSGFLVDMVKPDEYPAYSPAGFGDLTTGSTLFGGICAALLKRGKTGQGDKISISLYGTAIWLMSLIITSTQSCYGNYFPKSRFEGNPVVIPYRCQDEQWLMLSILEYDRFWARFCRAIGQEQLIDDKRFATQKDMLLHKGELILILEAVFRSRTCQEWMERLEKADIVHTRLCHTTDIHADRQAWENGFLYDFTHQNGNQAILPCTPLHSEEAGPLAYHRGPMLGEHTRELLREIGYSEDQIQELQNEAMIKAR